MASDLGDAMGIGVDNHEATTFFVQHGDLVGRLAVSLSGLLFVYLLIMRFRKPMLEHSR